MRIYKYLIILIIVTVVLQIVSSSNTCFKCLNEGDECELKDSFKIGACRDGLICGGGDEDDFSKLKCIVPQGFGEGCVDSTVCDVGLMCNAESQKCEDIQFASIGENCTRDIECSYQDRSHCVNGICTFKTESLHEHESGQCEFDTDCKGGLVCVDNECLEAIQLNQSCSGSYVACDSLLFCSQTSQLCSSRYSIGFNESCSYIEGYDVQCNLDLTCSSDGICLPLIKKESQIDLSSNSSNNCASPSSSLQCPFGTYCDCNSGKCKKDSYDPSKYINEKSECLIKNKCRLVDNIHSKSSCFTRHCKSIDVAIHKSNQCNNTIYTYNYLNVEKNQSFKLISSISFIILNILIISILF